MVSFISILRFVVSKFSNMKLSFELQQAGGGGAPAAGVEIPSGAFVAKITNDAREDEMEEKRERKKKRGAKGEDEMINENRRRAKEGREKQKREDKR